MNFRQIRVLWLTGSRARYGAISSAASHRRIGTVCGDTVSHPASPIQTASFPGTAIATAYLPPVFCLVRVASPSITASDSLIAHGHAARMQPCLVNGFTPAHCESGRRCPDSVLHDTLLYLVPLPHDREQGPHRPSTHMGLLPKRETRCGPDGSWRRVEIPVTVLRGGLFLVGGPAAAVGAQDLMQGS